MLNAPLDFFCNSSKRRCSSFGRAGGAGEDAGVDGGGIHDDGDGDELYDDDNGDAVLKDLL